MSRVLTDPAHPCRARILAAYGRMVRVGPGSAGGASGTIVSTAAVRGAGVVVTCGTCAGDAGGAAGRGLVDPERDPPLAFSIGAPARLAGDAVTGGAARREAHSLFGGDDFSLAAIAGERFAPALDDPRGLAAARAPFVDVRAGASVLVLGFADAEGGELVASIGPVLAEDEARRRIPHAGAAAAPAYDPRAELAIAARALPGMLGGGAFDEAGRFVGVVVRAAAEPIDGAYLVRAVRATAIAARLSAALRAAPVPLRTRIVAFLP